MALRVIQGKSASKVYSVLLLSFTLSSSTLGSTPQSGNLQQALCLYLAPHQGIYHLRRELIFLIILDLVASSLGNALKGFLKAHNSHYFLINIKSSKKTQLLFVRKKGQWYQFLWQMRAEAAIKVALQLVQKWGGQLLRIRPAFAAATPPKVPPSESRPSPPFSLDFARVSTNSCAALHLLLRQLQLRRLRCWKRGFISFRS